MENKAFGKALELRTKNFATAVIRLSTRLPDTTEAKVIRRQLTKAGTSIGANYREANRSRSRADFKSRIKICESETSETQYWMEIVAETGWLTKDQLRTEYSECNELLCLFASIGKSTG
jgi:four helix bundle protein